MKAVICLLAVVAVACAVGADLSVENQFQEWRVLNNKFYSNKEEYAHRLSVFASNLKIIAAHNAGNSTFLMGATRWADMTNEEYRRTLLSYTFEETEPYKNQHVMSGLKAPDTVDWREHGLVNPIKDQGQCGSCYAFGGNAAMEASWAQAGHGLVDMSEQNIMDCSWTYLNLGCNGGLQTRVMDYVIDNKGVEGTATYPYTAKSSLVCKYNASNSVGYIISRSQSKKNDENALKDAVATRVMAIAIDAGQTSFQLYKSGLYYEPSCSSSTLNHAVAIVGYDSFGPDEDYWIVRNSWGLTWGDKGYVMMARNRNNNCGVANMAYYAVAR